MVKAIVSVFSSLATFQKSSEEVEIRAPLLGKESRDGLVGIRAAEVEVGLIVARCELGALVRLAGQKSIGELLSDPLAKGAEAASAEVDLEPSPPAHGGVDLAAHGEPVWRLKGKGGDSEALRDLLSRSGNGVVCAQEQKSPAGRSTSPAP